MSDLHDKARALLALLERANGRVFDADASEDWHESPPLNELAGTIRDLLAENEPLAKALVLALAACHQTQNHATEETRRAIAAEARLRELCEQEPVAWMTDHKFVCDNGITKRSGDASAWRLEGWRVQALIPRTEMPK